jgi:hypothetical protein
MQKYKEKVSQQLCMATFFKEVKEVREVKDDSTLGISINKG